MTDDALGHEDVLNLEETSQYLRIKRRTLYVLTARGVVPGVKIGGQWRFRRSQLDGLFEESQPPPRPARHPGWVPARRRSGGLRP